MSEEKFEFEKKWKDKIINGMNHKDADFKSISTSSYKLDWALGKPFMEGTIVELYGENSAGKTTLALEVACNAIRMGKDVFFIDMERKLREAQLNMIEGLDKSKFTIVYPDHGEEAGDMLEQFVKTMPGCVVIVDSVSAFITEMEDAEDASKSLPASIARLCAKIIRKITAPVAKNKCVVIFINHIISTMAMFGAKETVKGGRAIGDRASQRIHLQRNMSDLIKDEESGDTLGQVVKCKVVKNNVARPFLAADVPIIYGKGIWKSFDLFCFAKDVGIITEPSKGWFEVDGKKSRKDAILTAIDSDKNFRDGLVSRLKEMYGG